MANRIEELIDDIEEYIDGCKFQPLSNNKIIVNKEEIDELIAELRLRVPEEIKKYQRIINQQDAILKDAQAQAQNMLDDAQAQIDVLVSEHEVTELAYQRANELIEDARVEAEKIIGDAYQDADTIRGGAVKYTDSLIASVQNIISANAVQSRQKMDEMFDVLQNLYDECADNRASLSYPAESDET